MLKLLMSLVLVFVVASVADAAAETGNNSTAVCRNGLLLPKWPGDDDILSLGDRISRGLIYFLALCYMFVGVSIVADRFMAAIEVITSQEKEITLKRPNGETHTVVVRIWNETVANLTLMALGSSAPEILLSIIEICGTGFEAGELGPGTIVGSAAFNLFIITSICVYVVPDGTSKKIKHLRVFFITATWSVFAYVWLYIILAAISPGIIDVWEGLLTFMFFPLTVLTAYIADRRLLIYKYLSKSYRMNKRGVIVEGEGTGGGDVEMATSKINHVANDTTFKSRFDADDYVDSEIKDFEEHRRDYIEILRELRKKHPECDLETIEAMAMEEIVNKGPKSRAFYRIQATRKLTGGGNVLKKTKERFESSHELMKQAEKDEDSGVTRVFFDPGHYTVMENVGEFAVTVTRQGGDLNAIIMVDYKTEDGTANAESDYVYAEGTLIFHPGETHKQFTLRVIDDDVFEEDEHFYVRLSNVRLQPTSTLVINGTTNRRSSRVNVGPTLQLASPSLATIMILDDDHAGIFSFSENETETPESIGQMQIIVNRFSGARGRVAVPFRTVEGTAKAGKHFEPAEGEIIFEDNETDKCILVTITEEDSYEKDVIFVVELGEPVSINDNDSASFRLKPELNGLSSEDEQISLLGKPRLGDIIKTHIRIKESKEFKNTVDKLIKMANVSLMVGTSSWKEQFIDAITVAPGDDDDDVGEKEDAEIKMPSCSDYILHFTTIFWKVLFATIPPTDYLDGWLCFIVSILLIGVLTALIGDLASHFGCSIGLKDSVTAISFVALGTSIPDTFASKVAALHDEYADSSIGNVTGSNAVNVFLGLGIAWSMAAIYHALNGTTFHVPTGSLAYSVTLFCTLALIAIGILMYRRTKRFGGELGGPRVSKLVTTFILIFFWVFYVVLSSLEIYKIIPGF